jgi:magnesium chelatase subunit I
MAVVAQEARPLGAPGVQVTVPTYMAEVVAAITHQARRSAQVNQRSGVSVRLSIANQETLVANALRRALRLGEPEAVPRVSDLGALTASTSGKVEIETLEEGREGDIVDRLVKGAVLETWRAWCRPERFRDLVAAFEGGLAVDTGDDVPSSAYAGFADLPGIKETLADLEVGEAPAEVASAVEFVLEGLHLSKRLNKDAHAGRATYRARS